MKKKIYLTNEQIEFREKILKIKPKPKKRTPLRPTPKVTTRSEYMNNCMFWINEFEAGRVHKDRFINAVICLRNYCNDILKENNQNKQS